MNTPSDPIQLRAAFWPRYFRWALAFQFGVASLYGIGGLTKVVREDWQPPPYFFLNWGVVAAVMAMVALFIAFRRRSLGCAELTPLGIRPYTTWSNWDIRYRWQSIDTARVKAGPFGNRWLEVTLGDLDAPPFKLTAHPTDPAAVLDALERFAGEHHPLTRAYATLLEVA